MTSNPRRRGESGDPGGPGPGPPEDGEEHLTGEKQAADNTETENPAG
jgi:hypothetical protein